MIRDIDRQTKVSNTFLSYKVFHYRMKKYRWPCEWHWEIIYLLWRIPLFRSIREIPGGLCHFSAIFKWMYLFITFEVVVPYHIFVFLNFSIKEGVEVGENTLMSVCTKRNIAFVRIILFHHFVPWCDNDSNFENVSFWSILQKLFFLIIKNLWIEK